MAKKRKIPPVAKMVAGGTAGIIAKTAVAPVERIRILAQTGESRLGTMGTLTKIVKDEGFLGLWRGNVANCLRVFPAKAVLFYSNDMWKSKFKFILKAKDLPPGVGFISGSLAGMTASFATYPLDFARTRLSGTFASKFGEVGIWPVMFKTIQKEGITGLYKGIGPTLFGALPYEGIKFGCYEILGNAILKRKGQAQTSILDQFLCGAVAGTISGFVMYPNDTVRKILQMQERDGKSNFNGALDCYVRTFRNEGLSRFYRGVVPYLSRMIPNSAIQFGIYESFKQWYQRS
mmetsp:Transcript_4258/g.6347  ORF Transcript_4258/g.6347 Transcript_4258/m.6347 type:complete len:290 (+) Transcript_4258:23-892(+)